MLILRLSTAGFVLLLKLSSFCLHRLLRVGVILPEFPDIRLNSGQLNVVVPQLKGCWFKS